jgi:hypothetical protein
MAQAEEKQILSALRANAHNRTHTAKALGISRRTLQNKINLYKIPSEPKSGIKRPSKAKPKSAAKAKPAAKRKAPKRKAKK